MFRANVSRIYGFEGEPGGRGVGTWTLTLINLLGALQVPSKTLSGRRHSRKKSGPGGRFRFTRTPHASE